MSTEESTKSQNALWWIVSIAASVLCCSVIFVLFASYLVEVKADVRDDVMRLNAVEQREDKILAELEAMHKHETQPAQAVTAPAASDQQQTPTAPVSAEPPQVTTPAPVMEMAPATEAAPVVPPISAPTVSAPSQSK